MYAYLNDVFYRTWKCGTYSVEVVRFQQMVRCRYSDDYVKATGVWDWRLKVSYMTEPSNQVHIGQV